MANVRSPEFLALMAKATELKMTRDERIEFAQFFLKRDITTWKQLSDEQVRRMLDAFNGFELLLEVIHQRVGS